MNEPLMPFWEFMLIAWSCLAAFCLVIALILPWVGWAMSRYYVWCDRVQRRR